MCHLQLRLCGMRVVRYLLCVAIFTFFTGVVAVASSSECDVLGTCSQICSDTQNGSYKCSCLEGFQLGQDNRSCSPIDPQWKIIYTTNTGVRSISKLSNGTLQKTDLTNGEWNPKGVTYDARSNAVYWTDVTSGSGAIYRINLNNTSETQPEKIANIGLHNPRGIAFDWITGNIYFIDPTARHIGVCRKDKDECVVVAKTETPGSGDLALHPNQGLMFWVDENGRAIFRAGMDGSFKRKIQNLGYTLGSTGIAVDQGNSRIFWTNDGDSLESARLDGSDRHDVFSSPLFTPFVIDVLGDMIFWWDDRIHHITSANKYNGSNAVTHEQEVNVKESGLALFHIANQPILRVNPCQRADNCSHICTLSPNATEFKCFCPVGMILGNDTRTCVELQNVIKLVIAFNDTIQSMRFNAIGKNVFEPISVPQIKSISDIVYNPINHTLILSDIETKTIYEYSLDSKLLNVLVHSHLDMVTGLDIDVVGENLYWIDSGKKTIEVMALRTGARTVILNGMEHAFSILVVPQTGLLFLAKRDEKGKANIYKIFLNGDKMRVFQRQKEPISLAYDKKTGNILWADKVSGNVESISTDGSSISILLSSRNVTSDVVKYEDKLFWVDIFKQELKYLLTTAATSQKPRSVGIGLPSLNENSSASNIGMNLSVKMTIVDRDLSYLQTFITQHDCYRENPWRKPCSHMCLLTGKEFVGECQCPDGLTLDKDGVTCKKMMACNENNCPFICPYDFFKCSTLKHCVDLSFVCNGVRDCEDGSDETASCDRSTTCSPEQFACKSGKCIDLGFACDGNPNCEDNEDEINCGSTLPVKGEMHDLLTETADAHELVEAAESGELEDDWLTLFVIIYGSILSIILLAGVIALVLNTFKRVGTVEDLFQL